MIVLPLYLGLVAALFLVLPILIGVYVYRDATSRSMNASLWTLITVLSPAAIGLIVYLIVRSDYSAYQCPNCKAPITDEYTACPQCGTPLKAKCAKCGNALSPSWKNCAHCGEPVPEDVKITSIPIRKDTGLGKILAAVLLIPVLIITTLFFGLASFRSSNPSSISSADGMLIEDFADNKGVSDWLKNCDESGTGIYVLEYQYPQDPSNNLKQSDYIVYRNGLKKDVNVAAVGSQGFFKKSLRIDYQDTETTGATDYHIYQVDQSSTEKLPLEIFVNGEKSDYVLTKSSNPLMFAVPIWERNAAVNLYRHRIDYLGNNNEVYKLIDETGLPYIGELTFELKTGQKPYGLRIIYASSGKNFDTIDFSSQATELLGLIKNLDYVEITNGIKTYKLTAEDASMALGYDVKEFGTNPEKLKEYLKSFDD